MTKTFLTILLLITCTLGSSGCSKQESSPQQISVLVSIAPYAYFVEKIAGSAVTVETLVPAGANPHIYEPKPKEVGKLRQVKAWFRLGEPSDQKVYSALKEQNPSLQVFELTQGIPLLSSCQEKSLSGEHHHCHAHGDTRDIHIWLSPRLAKKQAETVAQGLIAIDPDHKDHYEEGLQVLLRELDELDGEIASLLAPKKGEAILVSHPAFAYFCRDYQLIQLSVEMEGKDPLPRDITHLLQEAKKYQIASVLLQPQYSNKGARLIAEQLHIPVATVDPYQQDYIKNLREIAQIIAQ